jgi:phosphate transport system permease protein
MLLPILIRTCEETFRMVSPERRAGAAALGFDRFAVFWRISLPESQAGIAAGVVLAIGRSMAETAALVFTSGYVDRMPGSLFDSGRALSIHVYDLSTNVPGGDARAAASAFVLLGTVLCLNLLARRFTLRSRQSHRS